MKCRVFHSWRKTLWFYPIGGKRGLIIHKYFEERRCQRCGEYRPPSFFDPEYRRRYPMVRLSPRAAVKEFSIRERIQIQGTLDRLSKLRRQRA